MDATITVEERLTIRLNGVNGRDWIPVMNLSRAKGRILLMTMTTGAGAGIIAALGPSADAHPGDYPSPSVLAASSCTGHVAKVPRCVWIRWDQTNRKLRGWGDIHDRKGDEGNYNVKITNIRLYRNGDLIATSKDADDWHATHDYGYTSTVNCQDGNWVVAADMWWENMETHDKYAVTQKTSPEYIDC